MDWIGLISGLLGPLLAKCFKQTSSEDPIAYLRSEYNAAPGRMNPDVCEDCIPAVRRAAIQARRQMKPRDRRNAKPLSRQDMYDIAEAKLLEAIKADPAAVAAVMQRADSIEDE
jgi:hypothetical protein